MPYTTSTTHSFLPLVLAIGTGHLFAPPSQATPSDVMFTDVTNTSGLGNFIYDSVGGHHLGLIWIDYNNDDLADLFITNGMNGMPHMYTNLGNGRFYPAVGLLPRFSAMEMSGAKYVDYDNDGDQDIFIMVTNEQFHLAAENEPDGPPDILLRNHWVENGNSVLPGLPLFENVAEQAGVSGSLDVPLGPDYNARRSAAGGFLDYNRDGCIDLYVGHMVLQAAGDPSNANVLYKNNCDGTFTNASAEAGLNDGSMVDKNRPTLAFIAADFNNDNWPDLYVCNVHEAPPYSYDVMYFNNGNGTFTDATASQPNVGDDAQSCMGIDAADVDNDGDLDMYLSDVFFSINDELPLGNTFYENLGGGIFSDNEAENLGMSGEFSWAVNFIDVDNDTHMDLFVGTSGMNKLLYYNNGDGSWTETGAQAGFSFTEASFTRGAAQADYDHDGDMDIAYVNEDGIMTLMRNDSNSGNWLQIKLAGVLTNRSAINTTVLVQTSSGILTDQLLGGESVHSQSENILHFGLAQDTVVPRISIRWPTGAIESYGPIAINQRIQITEGDSMFIPDTDNDGAIDSIDNCPNIRNRQQTDSDGDGLGDVCDPN